MSAITCPARTLRSHVPTPTSPIPTHDKGPTVVPDSVPEDDRVEWVYKLRKVDRSTFIRPISSQTARVRCLLLIHILWLTSLQLKTPPRLCCVLCTKSFSSDKKTVHRHEHTNGHLEKLASALRIDVCSLLPRKMSCPHCNQGYV